jgi:hypothetical protein
VPGLLTSRPPGKQELGTEFKTSVGKSGFTILHCSAQPDAKVNDVVGGGNELSRSDVGKNSPDCTVYSVYPASSIPAITWNQQITAHKKSMRIGLR